MKCGIQANCLVVGDFSEWLRAREARGRDGWVHGLSVINKAPAIIAGASYVIIIGIFLYLCWGGQAIQRVGFIGRGFLRVQQQNLGFQHMLQDVVCLVDGIFRWVFALNRFHKEAPQAVNHELDAHGGGIAEVHLRLKLENMAGDILDELLHHFRIQIGAVGGGGITEKLNVIAVHVENAVQHVVQQGRALLGCEESILAWMHLGEELVCLLDVVLNQFGGKAVFVGVMGIEGDTADTCLIAELNHG